SNLGRLMRYYAQYYVPLIDGIRQEFSQQERQSYHKAFDYYLRGLKLVESRSDLFEIYRTLSWELSNGYFAMAISLQDYAPLSTTSQEDKFNISRTNGRIQTFLKEIVKILKITSSKKLIYEDYKEMYSISLRLNDTSTTFPRDLHDAIERLKKIYEKNTSD
ncbi:unnamed protein product, partial [Rotaria sp. Silwood1]